MPLNKPFIAATIAALQSGKFTHAKAALRRRIEGGGLSHCCLGVMCELVPQFPELPQITWHGHSVSTNPDPATEDTWNATLPPELSRAIGFMEGDQQELYEANDAMASTDYSRVIPLLQHMLDFRE